MALYGIDVSTFQRVGTQGDDFTIIRATYGTGYVDEKCDKHYQAAKKAGKLRGVYHYAYPQYNEAVDEANWFVDNIEGYIGDAILVLDWEEGDKANVGWALAFLDQVYARTGVRPLIYMSASVTGIADWSPVAANYALWCAGYPNSFNVANPAKPAADGSDMPYNTGAFPFATIWQYSSSAGTLDMDIAYMSAEAWNRFATPVHQQPSPEQVPEQSPVSQPVEEPVPTTDPTPTEPTPTPDPTPVPPVVVVSPTPAVTWKDTVLRIFHSFWQSFLAAFALIQTTVLTNALNVHNYSEAKTFIAATLIATGTAALSAVKNVIKLYRDKKL